ncbi:hypothetical protein GYB59_19095 [bacterium]|nr:hypothetical protein [bacterium]
MFASTVNSSAYDLCTDGGWLLKSRESPNAKDGDHDKTNQRQVEGTADADLVDKPALH